MYSSRVHRSFFTVGGASIATTSVAWLCERQTALTTSRASCKMTEVTSRNFLSQQRAAFATTSAPKLPEASKAGNKSFVEWYEGHLAAHPIPTKMVTGTILWSLGDAVAQVMPQVAFSESDSNTFKYDWQRTGRAALFGFAVHAPASHFHFNFLEWLTNRAGVSGLGRTFFKTFMEQFVYWSWISNSMYHGFMGMMQGMTMGEVNQRISDVLWETQKAQWVFWIPVQLLNFKFVPVRHQLNVVLATSVVWTALLSAWYPPEESNGNKAENEEEKRRLEK